MTYNTYSANTPQNYTGSITESNIHIVDNNPTSPEAYLIKYPGMYDQFVNKTSADSTQALPVTDEKRDLVEVVRVTGGSYQGYIYLHHVPLMGSEISVSDAAAIIQSGSVDYTNGIVFFDTIPTGQEFTFSYISNVDSIWGDHINSIQNAVMELERTLGAGSLTGEGIKNVEYWVDSVSPNLLQLMPNLVHVRALDRNVELKGSAGASRTITVGNSLDTLTQDVATWTVKSTDPSTNVSGQYGQNNNNQLVIHGALILPSMTGATAVSPYNKAVLAVGNPYKSRNTLDAAPTGYPYPTGSEPIAYFYGDIMVVGDVYMSGQLIALNTATGEQVNVISETLEVGQNLRVTGNTILGNNTNTSTNVNGTLTVGRWIHVQGKSLDRSRVDGPVDLRNPGNIGMGLGGTYADAVVPIGPSYYPDNSYHNKGIRTAPAAETDVARFRNAVIDGLDPSYVAKLLAFRAFDRHDFKPNTINDGRRAGIAGSVTANPSSSQSTFQDTGLCWPTSLMNPSSWANAIVNIPTRWFSRTGNYYHGKFENQQIAIYSGEFSGHYVYGDGNQWIVEWTQQDPAYIPPVSKKIGARVPLNRIAFDYFTGRPYEPTGCLLNLSRAFNTPITSGDSYQLFHPRHTPGNVVVREDVTTVTVYGSETQPIIANINGIHKVITSSCTHSVPLNFTGLSFVYFELDTPEIARSHLTPGVILESDASITVSQSLVETDSRIPIGEFYSEDPGIGLVTESVITHAFNASYDTLWFRVNSTGNMRQFGGNADTMLASAAFTGNITNVLDTGGLESPSGPYISKPFLTDVLADNNIRHKTRIHHRLGTMNRWNKSTLKVMVAPNIPGPADFSAQGGRAEHSGNQQQPISFNHPMGPDYAYIQELSPTRVFDLNNQAQGLNLEYPCYEVVHADRNYCDIVFYNVGEIPGAIIGARTPGQDRDIALEGTYSGNLGGGTVSDRRRDWWWCRVVIE
jgi:hypothetical protein